MTPIRCSICDRLFEPASSPALPFCGERCRLIDLGRWLKEGYGLAYERPEDPDAPEWRAEAEEP